MLSFRDIQTVRRIDRSDKHNPLPTLSLLVLETAWLCHYLAFADNESREVFVGALNSAIFSHSESAVISKDGKGDKDTLKAHLWEGVQTSADLSLSGGRGKWAPIYSSLKYKQRQILNGRRMTFDVEPFQTQEDDLEGHEEKVVESIGKVVGRRSRRTRRKGSGIHWKGCRRHAHEGSFFLA
uniref:Uncharacterized protein n=1 Tax=Ditylum brightwellii TaxID=49249 RepID=A0A7S4VLZ2_9STRA